MFDDAGKVRYVPLTANDRFAALQAGSIDVLSRNSTWTMSRETELKLVFPAVTYFDGQGFLIRRARYPPPRRWSSIMRRSASRAAPRPSSI